MNSLIMNYPCIPGTNLTCSLHNMFSVCCRTLFTNILFRTFASLFFCDALRISNYSVFVLSLSGLAINVTLLLRKLRKFFFMFNALDQFQSINFFLALIRSTFINYTSVAMYCTFLKIEFKIYLLRILQRSFMI